MAESEKPAGEPRDSRSSPLDIDVIVCSHNRRASLIKTLEKLLAVREPPAVRLRLTVVLNACTDDSLARTRELLRESRDESSIPTQILEEPLPGLKQARLRGVDSTTADHFVFLDDDCHVRPDWAEILAAALRRFPDGVGFGGEICIPALRESPAWMTDYGWLFAEQKALRDDTQPVEFLVGACVCYKRQALEDCGWTRQAWLDDRIGRRASSGADVEMSLRAKRYGCLRIVKGLCVEHRIESERLETAELCKLSYGLGHGSSFVAVIECQSTTRALLSQLGKARGLVLRAARKSVSSLLARRPWLAPLRVDLAFIAGLLTGCLAIFRSRGRRIAVLARATG